MAARIRCARCVGRVTPWGDAICFRRRGAALPPGPPAGIFTKMNALDHFLDLRVEYFLLQAKGTFKSVMCCCFCVVPLDQASLISDIKREL
jgi:hypothetical protein